MNKRDDHPCKGHQHQKAPGDEPRTRQRLCRPSPQPAEQKGQAQKSSHENERPGHIHFARRLYGFENRPALPMSHREIYGIPNYNRLCQVRDMIRVRAKHPHWIGFLLLSEHDGVVVHEGHESRGRYQLRDRRLSVKWDQYPEEEFIEQDGVFVYTRARAKENKAERDLVIFRSGIDSLHPTWKAHGSRAPWDIYVSPYQEIPSPTPISGITIGDVIPGPPWAALSILLKKWTGWRDYRYVMLADDDLLMSESAVTSFFGACGTRGAKLAQPSLNAHSFFSHLLTVQNSSFSARKVTFVEIMTPCFQAAVLHELLWTFDLSETGWGYGLDMLWPKLLDYEDLYIMDDTPVRHTRPIGLAYESIKDRVLLDGQRITARFDCPLLRKVRAGYRPDGQILYDGDPTLLYMLIRGYDHIFQVYPPGLLPYIQEQLTPIPSAQRKA